MIQTTIEQWHQVREAGDLEGLGRLLADDVVFYSPVVHSPQEGKDITLFYLTGAFHVLCNEHFHYVREVLDGEHAVLEFVTEVDGIQINGVDMIQCNAQGQIVDFKVMVRPLKAINLLHEMMAAMLQSMSSDKPGG